MPVASAYDEEQSSEVVPQLVRGEPATNTGESGDPAELFASG
jgi:hypothetical protein